MSGVQVMLKIDIIMIKNMMMMILFFFFCFVVCLLLIEFIFLQMVIIIIKFNEIVVNRMDRLNKEKMNELILFIVDLFINFRKYQELGQQLKFLLSFIS